MRITNKMLSNNFLRDMNNNLENMQTLQQQMTSGKEIRKPSDDPFKVSRAMQLNTNINANKQYNENIKDTTNWLNTTDTALGQAGDVLQRVRELLVSAGNAAYGSSEKTAIKDEINQKISEFAQILNTNFDGKYIFGGTRGTGKPVDAVQDPTSKNTKLDYNIITPSPISSTNQVSMIKATLSVEVSQGVSMDYNINAGDILEGGGDLRTLFNNITDHLDGNIIDTATGTLTSNTEAATAQISGNDLQGVTDAINNLLKLRSQVGAKQNRMESAQGRNEEENYNMTELLSKTEDIDITQKTMEYATAQTVYMASLQTSAKVIQPTLMDYLR